MAWSIELYSACAGPRPEHRNAILVPDGVSIRDKALRHLAMAKDADIWPRTTAPENLLWLHGLAQEWEKVDKYLVILREEYEDIGGVAIADKLQSQMQRVRAKLEARKARELTVP
ncbi:MAG: hypothetical protein JSU63_13740 [Phycisphaerales bacterium]|nr:MAG: hypothetical protein JSU63_13740 [Phycisphaerales bacterium]